METNVYGVEKNIRLAAGAACVMAGLFGRLPTGARVALLAVGAVGLTTALTGYCPVNHALGRGTPMDRIPEAARGAWHEAQQVLAE